MATPSTAPASPWHWIVPDGLWDTARTLVPEPRTRPQGGGTANTSDEALFAAIVYVLVSGCAWRSLPPCFGVSKSTVHRRFLIWSDAHVWTRLHEDLLRRRAGPDLTAVSRHLLDAARLRTETGANTRTRDAWSAEGRIARCGPCRRRADCPWSVRSAS
ncbi:transposase [Streptomyces sp. 4F14]|uniref:transposase n=1 Tax=Streptomyces sp. 4F14 TaxID=3394380 RepID=UPI003A89B3F7